MRRLICSIVGLAAMLAVSACSSIGETLGLDTAASPTLGSTALNVSDLCVQAANAETALAAEIRAGKLSPAKVDKVAAAKLTVDSLCLDQSWTASQPEQVAKLRATVPVLVAIAIPTET